MSVPGPEVVFQLTPEFDPSLLTESVNAFDPLVPRVAEARADWVRLMGVSVTVTDSDLVGSALLVAVMVAVAVDHRTGGRVDGGDPAQRSAGTKRSTTVTVHVTPALVPSLATPATNPCVAPPAITAFVGVTPTESAKSNRCRSRFGRVLDAGGGKRYCRGRADRGTRSVIARSSASDSEKRTWTRTDAPAYARV